MSIPDILVLPFGADFEPHLAYEHSVTHAVDVAVKKPKPSEVVMEAIKARIGSGQDEAFFIADLGSLKRQYRKWARLLPRVGPHYAIKCNTDPELLKTLVPLCEGFDCASMGEIQTMLDLGVSPSNIIYANPCKPPAHIRYARDNGIHLMTFDNVDELYKVHAINPDAKMVLRILTDDSHSVCQFGVKFGAHLSITQCLLETAKKLGLEVVGVSFHVGSGCMDPIAYDDAIRRAKGVFEQGLALGFNMTLLDVGGGFPGTEKAAGNGYFGADHGSITFEDVAPVINKALDTYFPESHIKVIGEPGRYFAAPAFTLVTSITSRRVTVADRDENKSIMYYTNDGVYGSFNCLMFDHAVAKPLVLTRNNQMVSSEDDMGPLYQSSVWGPTCDSLDVITKEARLPELSIGDWLYYEEMGAYTVAAASRFNGFNLSRVFYVDTEI